MNNVWLTEPLSLAEVSQLAVSYVLSPAEELDLDKIVCRNFFLLGGQQVSSTHLFLSLQAQHLCVCVCVFSLHVWIWGEGSMNQSSFAL